MSVATWEKTPILYSSTDYLFNKQGNQVKIIVLMIGTISVKDYEFHKPQIE